MNSNYTMCYFPRRVFVVDTTLRDGNQSAYGTMFDREKLAIAEMLEWMGVDVIESGFAVSNGNGEFMKEVAKRVKKPYLSGLSRGRKEDIYATYEAYKNYDKRMIHIFLPTSDVQVRAKFDKSQDELTKIAVASVKYAKQFFDVVEFTAEDAARSNLDFLKRIYGEAVNAGARVANIADTVGCSNPWYFGNLVRELGEYVKRINPYVKVSVHCHNDLGLAFANTLAGIKSGADIAEVTVNGLGERAGNCPLELVAGYTEVEPQLYCTKVSKRKLYAAAKLVERATGMRNDFAPIVGRSAFAHKSGIHQHALTIDRRSYEILNARMFDRESEIVIGPHSGIHGMIAKAKQLGFTIDEEFAKKMLQRVADMVKEEKQKHFSDRDIEAMLKEVA